MTKSWVEQQYWFRMLSSEIRMLVDESIILLEREGKDDNGWTDYSFVVFPAAKAYEGFLKEYFYAVGMIGRKELMDDHFRIGKSLNPDLPKKYRGKDWVYDNVESMCGVEVANYLWQAWREGRNQLFHYQYGNENKLSLEDAEEKLKLIFEAMRRIEECGANSKGKD